MSGEDCDSVDGCHGHGNTYNSRGNSGMCGKKEAVWRVDGSQCHGSMHHAVSRPCTMQKKRSCRRERKREREINKIQAKVTRLNNLSSTTLVLTCSKIYLPLVLDAP